MTTVDWRVSGTYFEVCNCDAICRSTTRWPTYSLVMRPGTYVTAKAAASVPSDLPISCGIPGHDRQGEEVLADVMRVEDGAFSWDVHGRCGFASDFDYRSESE